MTVLAILAILAAIATPAFNFLKKDRVRALASQLQADLSYARLEAMRRKRPVALCNSTDGATCGTATDWSTAGWLIFVDGARSGNPSTAGNEILLFHSPERPASVFTTFSALTYELTGDFATEGADRTADLWVCSSNPTLVVRISLPLIGNPVSYVSDSIPTGFPTGATCT